tara:strand:- start:860 stop:1510 length:651 start_codon:yes stop_codon:yes gene_type:complete
MKPVSPGLKEIYATKIQRTWRRYWRIDQKSEIHRAQSKLHKIENKGKVFWNVDDIGDPFASLPVIKKGQKVYFGKNNEVRNSNSSPFKEPVVEVDGIDKPETNFTRMVIDWFDYKDQKGLFFELKFIKKYIDNPSSKYWDNYLEETNECLRRGERMNLWANNGKNKVLFPHMCDDIKELSDYWKLYNIKKSLVDLRGEVKDISFTDIETRMQMFLS